MQAAGVCQIKDEIIVATVIEQLVIFTSHAGAVAKYCNVHVCGYVCLSAKISPEPNARSLPIIFMHAACGCGSVLLRHGDEIPRERGNFGGFLPQ